jgi:hypothetical protein
MRQWVVGSERSKRQGSGDGLVELAGVAQGADEAVVGLSVGLAVMAS